jgi:hypothetical protein
VSNDREAAVEAVLAAYERDFDRLEANTRALEAKAQGAIATAGIFIAFALGFAMNIDATAAVWVRLLLAVTILLLVVSMGAASLALKVRFVKSAPGGSHLEEILNDLYTLPTHEKANYLLPLLQNRVHAWESATADRLEVNDKKARLISRSQYFLLAAALAAAVLSLVLTFTSQSETPLLTGGPSEVRQVWVQSECDTGWLLCHSCAEGARHAASGAHRERRGRAQETKGRLESSSN